MPHEIRGVDVAKYALLCQQTSPKRWFGNREMTSNCDVTSSEYQIQMTTIWPWTKPPVKIFCVRHWLLCIWCYGGKKWCQCVKKLHVFFSVVLARCQLFYFVLCWKALGMHTCFFEDFELASALEVHSFCCLLSSFSTCTLHCQAS